MRKKLLLPIALLLVAYGYTSINIALPIFPVLSKLFFVDIEKMKLTMTLFLFCYAAFQLIWGTLSDSLGRRKVMLWSVSIGILGTIITLVSSHFSFFLLGRLIEAVGVGSTAVLARAILVDSRDELNFEACLIYIISCASLMPGMGQLIGGDLFVWTRNWHLIFLFLLILGFITLGFIYFGFKDSVNLKYEPLSFKAMWRHHFSVIKNPQFLTFFIIYGFILGLFINFYTIAPYIFMRYLHVLYREYGLLMLIVGGCYLMGAMITRVLIKYLTMWKILLLGLFMSCITSVMFIGELYIHLFSVLGMMIPLGFFAVGAGFVSPACNSLALTAVPEKGSASALMASSVMLCAALFSWIALKLPFYEIKSCMLLFIVFSFLTYLITALIKLFK